MHHRARGTHLQSLYSLKSKIYMYTHNQIPGSPRVQDTLPISDNHQRLCVLYHRHNTASLPNRWSRGIIPSPWWAVGSSSSNVGSSYLQCALWYSRRAVRENSREWIWTVDDAILARSFSPTRSYTCARRAEDHLLTLRTPRPDFFSRASAFGFLR